MLSVSISRNKGSDMLNKKIIIIVVIILCVVCIGILKKHIEVTELYNVL